MDPSVIVFVIALVSFVFVVITMRVVVVESIHRRARQQGLRDAIDGAIDRLDRLEEERDFYTDLLDLPEMRRAALPPAVEEDE